MFGRFLLLLWVIGFAGQVFASTVSVKSFDGFSLDAIIEKPQNIPDKDIKKVVVFVHGSGSQNMDEDLSEVTFPKGAKLLFFKDIADVLHKKGIATVRYNKRSYEIGRLIKKDEKFINSQYAKKYKESPLQHTLKDAEFFADYAKKRFPKADIHLLGHSEGTKVVLNATKAKAFVKGVVLIGFWNETLAASLLEQIVYRNINLFSKLDRNADGLLAESELKGDDPIAKSILSQLSTLDLNGDKKLSLSEFKAGNYLNLISSKEFDIATYARDEAKLMKPSDIIQAASIPMLFLQGEYDNQTPAFYTESIELANRLLWKKKNLKFVYFPKAGHALDPREDFYDIKYRVPPSETYEKIASEIADLQ